MKFKFLRKFGISAFPLAILFSLISVSIAYSNLYSKQHQIQVYFTPSPPPTHNFEIPITSNLGSSKISAYARILGLIQDAKNEITFAAYAYNLHNLNRALLNVLKRGVRVSVFIEKNQANLPETAYLLKQLTDAGGKVYLDRFRSGIMHNKFLLIDDSIVVTGSANFTPNGFFQQYNDVVIIHDRALLTTYRKYIYTLFRATPVTSTSTKQVQGIKGDLQVAFSRAKKIKFASKVPQTIIVNALKGCKTSVHLLTYVFTSSPILSGFKSCIKKNPTVKIYGIFDNQYANPRVTSRWRVVPFNELKRIGAKVRYDASDTKVHHKNIIIDADTVMTGSYNFSASAHLRNDENLLIIRDRNIAKRYLKRFEELWEEATIPGKASSLPLATLKKALQKKTFSGTVTTVLSGNLMEVELTLPSTISAKKSTPSTINSALKKTILVRLAGIMPPVASIASQGKHRKSPSLAPFASQNIQAGIAKESLIFLVGKRAIEGKILGVEYSRSKTKPPVVSALVYLIASQDWQLEQLMNLPIAKNTTTSKYSKNTHRTSVNEILLAQGLVYPLFNLTSLTDNALVNITNNPRSRLSRFVGGEKYFKHDLFNTFSASYSQHPEWIQELTHLERAFIRSYNLKLYLWGPLKLGSDPLSHLTYLELINNK